MPFLREYSVFICHAWDYHEDYYRLVEFLNAAPNFQWVNLSVPKHDPLAGDLERELRNQMREADVFLVLAGMYVPRREWIDFEMNFARRIGRPIIGIRPWSSTTIPVAVQVAAKQIVGWNTASIVSAIRYWALQPGE